MTATIDSTAVASVLGVAAEFKDMRSGSALRLPQRMAVFAQGKTGTSFSTDKWTATGAAAAGARFGYGSPIHLICRELFPANGDGVGTIPVDIFALEDDDSGAAAVGTVTPSGTPTETGSYKVNVSGILSDAFTVAAGALTTTALYKALRDMGAAVSAQLNMPVTVGYTYGSVVASALVGTGNGTITALSVHTGAAPKPGAWTLKVNTVVTHGGVWTLTDPDGVVVSTSVTMTPGAGGVTPISNAGGLDFTLTDASTDFGLNATFTITVPATNMTLTSNWKGVSANDLYIEVVEAESLGITFTLVQPTGGLVNPDVSDALARMGNVWNTLAVSGLNIEDETTLDLYQEFGEARWGATVRKPLVFFTGNTATTVAAATDVCSGRRDDKVNAQLVAPGSINLPFVVAARQAGLIAKVANENAPTSYQTQQATGLTPGEDGEQWDYLVRDQAVKLGSSTVEVKDSIVTISDVVTFYRPTGEDPPAYRYVVDIVKLQNTIFNLDVEFAKREWAAAPLISDDEPTTNPNAKQPSMAIAAANDIIGNLGLEAILTNTKAAKKLTTATINSGNAKRLDVKVTVQLSGNTNIVSVTLEFGFAFGQAALAA